MEIQVEKVSVQAPIKWLAQKIGLFDKAEGYLG